MHKYTRREAIKKFWSAATHGKGCWLWQKAQCGRDAKEGKGYGQVWFEGKFWHAHRLAWFLTKGAIPRGKHVCHDCNHKPCIRPKHLYLATNAKNMSDAYRDGLRSVKGEKNPRAKLTTKKVKEIRRRLAAGATQTALAKVYGVNQTMIGFIARRVSWK